MSINFKDQGPLLYLYSKAYIYVLDGDLLSALLTCGRSVGLWQLLTFPPPMIFSAAYTDLPQRGHLSTSATFLANLEALVGVEGRAALGDPLQGKLSVF